MWSQSKSPGLSWLAAVLPRSGTPTAPRMPKPRSVKFKPLRTVRPMPSSARQRMKSVATPPCRMKSSMRWPTSLSTKRGADGGFQSETFAQAARDVVFAAAFPRFEFAGRANASLAGVEPQHDFAERKLVVSVFVTKFQRHASSLQNYGDFLTAPRTKHTKKMLLNLL